MQANAQPRWYVMRAYKAERKAEAALKQSAIDHYVPKIFALRVYHGVKSRHLVPAIPSMVFVHACYDEILDFKRGSNFVQFVTRRKTDGGGPLVVPDRQMEDFIKVTSQNDAGAIYLKPEEINLQKGTPVRILGGPMDGVEGVFLKIQGKRNRRVVVYLEGVSTAAAVEVSPDLIEVIK